MRPRPGPKLKPAANLPWSAELAYAVGLLTTDGCLSKDGRHIDFTSKDKALISTLLQCLKLSALPIRKKQGGNGKWYPRIQISNVSLYRWLQLVGLTPRKSLTLGPLQIPNRYFFDFLRGCFDGDGSIYSFWDRRWKHSFMYYLSFTSGSYPFLRWLQQQIRRGVNISGSIGPMKRAFQLRYAKKETLVLFKKMFYAPNLPHLARKYQKAKRIFTVGKAR